MPIFRTLFEDTCQLIRNLNRGTNIVNESLCRRIADSYDRLSSPEKARYLSALALEHGLNSADRNRKSKPENSTNTPLNSRAVLSVKLPPSLPSSNWTQNGVTTETECWEDIAQTHVEALHRAQTVKVNLTPKYRDLFLTMGRLPTGVRWLVDIRADLSGLLSTEPALSEHVVRTKALQLFNQELKSLLGIWFSPGLMHLQRVTWDSPASLLDKLATYEAVHPLRSWLDLRQRVGPYRRCFVFTHPCLGEEPVVILHTALTQSIASSMEALLPEHLAGGGVPFQRSGSARGPVEDPAQVTAANFYSISAPHAGLQGIELGNSLIKRVLSRLQAEFPRLQLATSLSPIPGFTRWLLAELGRQPHSDHTLIRPEAAPALAAALGSGASTAALLTQLRCRLQVAPDTPLDSPELWANDAALTAALRTPLMLLCARYLYAQKRRGYALDPVANFHLRNGAVLFRLNWLADRSARGLHQSCGIMVNYRYYPGRTDQLAERYAEQKTVQVGDDVARILDLDPNREQLQL